MYIIFYIAYVTNTPKIVNNAKTKNLTFAVETILISPSIMGKNPYFGPSIMISIMQDTILSVVHYIKVDPSPKIKF